MSGLEVETDFEQIAADLDRLWEKQESEAFRKGVERLRSLANRGSLEAAEFLAEILALPGPLHDAAAAYKWYYIVLSHRGYSVVFEDLNRTPPFYRGPAGDFRNESMVNELVTELGFARVHELVPVQQ